MNLIHPEVITALKKAGESPKRGPWQSLIIFGDGTAQAVFQHGVVQFDADQGSGQFTSTPTDPMKYIRDLMLGKKEMVLLSFEDDDGDEKRLILKARTDDTTKGVGGWVNGRKSGYDLRMPFEAYCRLEEWETVEALEKAVLEYLRTQAMDVLDNYQARKLFAEFHDRIGGVIA